MNYLDHAVKLYQDERIKKLKIEYTLSDDKSEKQAIKLLIHNLKQEKQG